MNLQTQIDNCYGLLDYIDNGFQERLQRGEVNYKSYVCGSYRCLCGWYEHDVYNTRRPWVDSPAIANDLGMIDGDRLWYEIFGANEERGIHDRRAALVNHIKHLESQQRNFAAELMRQIEEGPVLIEREIA